MKDSFVLFDSADLPIREFGTYIEAANYRACYNRYDWSIRRSKSTPKQVAAVYFVEEILNIPFIGDITSKYECHIFLKEYLEEAKQFYTELKCEYETDRGY